MQEAVTEVPEAQEVLEAQEAQEVPEVMDRRIASLLSLASRAGKLATGEETAQILLRRSEAELIIITEDASQNTKKKFINKCFFYQKPVLVFGERVTLSKCVGKRNRTVYVVTDSGFALRLQALIDEVTQCPKPVFMN